MVAMAVNTKRAPSLFMKNEKEEIKVPVERREEERKIQSDPFASEFNWKARALIIITLKLL